MSSSIALPYSHLFDIIHPRLPIATLFPSTTLFRSWRRSPSCGTDASANAPKCGSALTCAGPSNSSANSGRRRPGGRSEEHTSELQSHSDHVCRLLLEKKIYTLGGECTGPGSVADAG